MLGMSATATQMMCGQGLSSKETAVGLSGSSSSPSELFLESTSTCILLQETSMCCAHQMFDQMPHQFGKLDNSKLEDNFVGEHMVPAEQKHVKIQASVVWDGAAQDGLDEMPCVDVVWDGEILADLNMNSGLLEQLASGSNYMNDEKTNPQIEHEVNEVIWDIEASDELFDERSAPAMIWDEELLSDHAAYNVLEEMPLKDNVAAYEVIWDEEPQQLDGEMGESLECKEVMHNSDVEGVLSELSYQVWWDEVSNYPNVYKGLLQQVIPGTAVQFEGVIFGGRPDEIEECLTKHLFGPPSDNCAYSDAENASVMGNSHSDTGTKESGEAVANWEDLDGNAVSLELGIAFPLFLHSGTVCGDELHFSTIAPTFWCSVEEQLIAVKVEWSPIVLFSHHFKLAWFDPNHKIASSVRRQWDPGIGTATAWGQAVFRGGGNVMAQQWPNNATGKVKPKSVQSSGRTTKGIAVRWWRSWKLEKSE